MDRRRFLGVLGAAALAPVLQGCGTRRTIEGGIVGAAHRRGHRLFEPPPGPATTVDETGVVIAGGGVAGLAAGWKLARSGFDDFVLLELEDDIGGTAVAGANDVSAFPWGAHYVPVPTRDQRALCELLAEADVIAGFDASGRARPREECLVRAPEERLFHRGSWMEGLWLRDGADDADRKEFDRFQAMASELARRRDQEGRRVFTIPVARCGRDPETLALDRISMAEWLARNGYRSPRLLWYVDYACRDDYGSSPATTSAWAGLHYFASRQDGDGGVPAEFLTWPDGNGFLVRALAAPLAGRIRTGATVLAVDEREGRVLVTWVEERTGVLRALRARRCVVALPQFAARRILRGADAAADGFVHSPWAVANVTLASRPASRGFPEAWDNVLYESPSLGYVVATHQTDRRDRATVWTWYRPYPDGDPAAARRALLGRPWESWRDEILADLRTAHPDIEDHVTRIDVRVWGHAMVRPSPGFLFGGRREAAARPRGLLHFAGADLGGLPLFEEAQWSGVRAAEEVLAALGRSFESSL